MELEKEPCNGERETFLGKGCISAVIITYTLLWSRFKCPSVCKWSSFCRKKPNQPTKKPQTKLKQSFLQIVHDAFPAMLQLIFLPFWQGHSLQKLKKLHEIFVWVLSNGKSNSNSHRMKNMLWIWAHDAWKHVIFHKIGGNCIKIKFSYGAATIFFFKKRNLDEEILVSA